MSSKRHTPEQIINKLRQAEVEIANGATVAQVCKKIGVTEQTYYRWRNEGEDALQCRGNGVVSSPVAGVHALSWPNYGGAWEAGSHVDCTSYGRDHRDHAAARH